ncbi:MAG TPA: class I SAM-dependent methyltransferase [Thermoleophilaceae bacterium]
MLSDEVLRFVLGALPSPPARVLEVGAGEGELAAALVDARYDVLAIDPAGEPPVAAIALNDVDEPDGSFDAAVAVVSLHHVEPLDSSLANLARMVRPGGVLAVDELDVWALDERAVRWWSERRRERGEHAPDDPAELIEEMRGHIHPLDRIYTLLEEWFELGPPVRGSYLHRWHLDLALRAPEEALIASGELPPVGVRFTARRR